MSHVQRTFHIQVSPEHLDPIARRLLGVGIDEIKSAF